MGEKEAIHKRIVEKNFNQYLEQQKLQQALLTNTNGSSFISNENPMSLASQMNVAGQVSFASQNNVGTAHHPIVNYGLSVPQSSMNAMNFNNYATTNVPYTQPSTINCLSALPTQIQSAQAINSLATKLTSGKKSTSLEVAFRLEAQGLLSEVLEKGINKMNEENKLQQLASIIRSNNSQLVNFKLGDCLMTANNKFLPQLNGEKKHIITYEKKLLKLPLNFSCFPSYSVKVFVGGIPWDLDEHALRLAFARFGLVEVQKGEVKNKSSSYCDSKGFVCF